MPKTKRDYLKRTLAQGICHIDTAVDRLKELEDIFRPVHPELADFLALIQGNLLVSKEWALDFWARAWGKRPPDYTVWRK